MQRKRCPKFSACFDTFPDGRVGMFWGKSYNESCTKSCIICVLSIVYQNEAAASSPVHRLRLHNDFHFYFIWKFFDRQKKRGPMLMRLKAISSRNEYSWTVYWPPWLCILTALVALSVYVMPSAFSGIRFAESAGLAKRPYELYDTINHSIQSLTIQPIQSLNYFGLHSVILNHIPSLREVNRKDLEVQYKDG